MEKINSSKYETLEKYYSYLYELGNAMFAYYDSMTMLSSEQIQLIANSSDEDKVSGMYFAARDRQRIKYGYSTFSKNTNAIRDAKIIKRSK